MGVVSHSYGGLRGDWWTLVVGMNAGQNQVRLVACLEMLEHFPSTR